jgi:hypothetical protein
MIDAAIPVLKELYRSFPTGGADLETICRIVTGVTAIDRTHYTGFDTPRTNPIWGMFKRFEQQDAPYAGDITVVHIRYAQHLSEDERIFVVSKELCHSLTAREGTHIVTDAAMDDLVANFSVLSGLFAGQGKLTPAPELTTFNMELLATIIASEMVCPVRHRRAIMNQAGEDPDWSALGASVKIPNPYRRPMCAISQMDAFERMLNAFGAYD